MDIGSPNPAVARRSPKLCFDSSPMTDQPASNRNAGTVTYATHPIHLNPYTTRAVTASPVTIDHTHTGTPPTRACSPVAKIAFWMPNQPIRLVATTSPISAEPSRPKPVQRASTEVDSPS